MLLRRWMALLLFTCVALLSQPLLSALDLPADPRPAATVADPEHRLSADAVQRIGAIARAATSARRGELVVVVLATTAGRPLRDCGTELFNRWRLGSAQRNDGLLIIAALADHRCELILGSGIDDPPQVVASQEIFDQVMKPRFRDGDVDGALIAGAHEAARRILGVVPEDDAPHDSAAGLAVEAASAPAAPEVESPRPPPPPAHSASQVASEPISPLWWWGGGVGVAALGLWRLRRWQRYRPRSCRQCNGPQTLLGEVIDDQHLDAGERTEERIGSIDYDVWHCAACGRVDKLAWRSWFTSYARCPACANRTLRSTSTTVVQPTTWSEGQARIDESCAHCPHSATHTRRIARRTASSSGASRGWGGSGGGGGFGGGSSRGGGGGGSW
jgi:uncharacterized protein